MTYRCSECKREVGRMLDHRGESAPFWCPHAQRMADPQLPGSEVPTPIPVAHQVRIAKV